MKKCDNNVLQTCVRNLMINAYALSGRVIKTQYFKLKFNTPQKKKKILLPSLATGTDI